MLIHDAATRAERRARGWWSDLRVQDLVARHAVTVPTRLAVVDPPNLQEITGQAPQRVTWAELHAATEQIACGLIRAGLRKDAIAVIQMANSYRLLATYLACARLGIVISPIIPQYREHELAHVLDLTSAQALIVDASIGRHDAYTMARGLQADRPGLRVFVNGGAAGTGDVAFATMLTTAPDASLLAEYDRAHPVSADDVFSILWTSGSEGRAKGVARTHNDWLLHGPHLAECVGIGDGVRLLNGRPLTTHGGFYGSLVPWLYHGGTLVNHHPFNLPLFLEQLRSEDIHFTALAPALLATLVAQPGLLAGLQPGSLRCVGSGSAPISPTLLREFEATFGVPVINFFGSTEGAALASTPDDVPDPELRARYFPRFGVPGFQWRHPVSAMLETRLVDLETGADITVPGRPGELRYRGPTVMTGYWNSPEQTAAAFDEQGYYRSGDLFEIAGDNHAYYAFAGRSKDIIIRGGFNISAQEIEDLISSHPAVSDVAVVGYPDARLGEKVCACVVLREAATLTLPELAAWLRDEKSLGVIKIPERLLVMENLPRNPNNKLAKPDIRKLAAQAQSA